MNFKRTFLVRFLIGLLLANSSIQYGVTSGTSIPEKSTQSSHKASAGSPAIHTGTKLPGILATENKKIFFLTYLWNQLINVASYTNTNPITNWPTKLESAPELAQKLNRALEIKDQISNQQFLFGASTSEHQCSKQCTPENCSWSRFANNINGITDDKPLPQPTDNNYPCDFWNNYQEYIDYLKSTFNLNALRFSVEWGLVQPHGPDSFDETALNHYANVFVYLIQKGITPVVCLHHYTDPCWFDDLVGAKITTNLLFLGQKRDYELELKGFESIKNIKYFTKFCNKVYETLTTKLDEALDNGTIDKENFAQSTKPLWATFNAPEGFVFKGYRQMNAPPADSQKQGLGWVTHVLEHVLDAHVKAYHTIHKTYDELTLQHKDLIGKPPVGILKNMLPLDSSHKSLLHTAVSPVSWLCGRVGDMMQNDSIFTFFTKGIYQVQIPFSFCIRKTHKDALGALDFIGINYYSNKYLFGPKEVIETDEEYKTDNGNYRIYPQGLYRAVQEVDTKLVKSFAATGKELPIYITENGIATTNDTKRNKFYQQYLTALTHAIEDGYDVRGYLTWTAFDNYEWPKITYDKKQKKFIPERNDRRFYGLCSVTSNYTEPTKTQLQIKDGAQFYQKLVTSFFNPEQKL